MRKIISLIFVLIFTFAQAAYSNNIQEYKLPSGQTVIIKEVKNNPIVIIDTFIKTGSVNENDKNNGVAHFLEHLFFKGTTNHKRGEFEKVIEKRGGIFNAATSRDYTHYYVKIDSKYFNEALALHSDMLLNIAIPQNELDMERKVVLEEITRSKDNPNNKVFDNFMSIIFNGTPYSRKILGTTNNIENITRDEILAYHDAWYKPENMVTVIVGDVDTYKIIPLISKYFSKSTSGNRNLAIPPKENPARINIKNNIISQKADVDTAYMILGYPSVGNNNPKEAYALDIAASILAGGQNSILYKSLKQDENLVLSEDAGNYSLKDTGVFYVDTTFAPQNYDKVLAKIKTELKNIKSKPIEEKRVNLVKNAIKRQFEYANESISSISNILGYDVAVGNGTKDYTEYLAVIDSITPEFIQTTLNKYLKDENLAISLLLPNKPKISKRNNIVNVNNKTCSNNAKLISTFKNIKKYKLNNGATLLLEKNTNNNVIATKIFIKGGSLYETKDGTADILSGTIKKATLYKTGKEIEDALDNIGTTVSVDNNFEYFEISMKTTKSDFNDAFPILKEILEKPAFNEKDINNTKKDAINSIKASRDNPQNIAFENFYDALYQNSKFLKTGKVLEKSIPNITRDDVIKLHNKIFAPKNMIISIVGNFDENDVISKFSQLQNSSNSILVNDELLKADINAVEANIIKKESKKSKGSWLIQGWQTKGLSSNDFITLKLISLYLGGGFTSKLFVNLRENKGLAYEVGASSTSGFNQGNFFIYIGTNPENINMVQDDFNNEINLLKTKLLTDNELNNIKSLVIGRLKLANETNMSKAYMNGYYEFFGKGYNFVYNYPKLLQKVTAQDIIKVSNKYFSKPYIMSIVADNKYIEDK